MIFFRAAPLFVAVVLTLTVVALPVPAEQQGDLSRRYTRESALMFRRGGTTSSAPPAHSPVVMPLHPTTAKAAVEVRKAASGERVASQAAAANHYETAAHDQSAQYHDRVAGVLSKITVGHKGAVESAAVATAEAQDSQFDTKTLTAFYKANPKKSLVDSQLRAHADKAYHEAHPKKTVRFSQPFPEGRRAQRPPSSPPVTE